MGLANLIILLILSLIIFFFFFTEYQEPKWSDPGIQVVSFIFICRCSLMLWIFISRILSFDGADGTVNLSVCSFVVSNICSDGGRSGAGDFASGFLLGGAVFGTLAYIFAPQVNGYPTFSFNNQNSWNISIDEYQVQAIFISLFTDKKVNLSHYELLCKLQAPTHIQTNLCYF